MHRNHKPMVKPIEEIKVSQPKQNSFKIALSYNFSNLFAKQTYKTSNKVLAAE